MLRSVLISTWLIAASVGIVCAQGSLKQGITKEQVGSSAEISTAPSGEKGDSEETVVVKPENSVPKNEYGTENTQDIQIQQSNLSLTRWLVIVGAVQAIILFFTIRAINQQTDANRNIERAWVMAELRCTPVSMLAHGDGPEGPTVSVMSIELYCVNDGNSPAWITEKSARLIIAGEGELPPVPQLTKEDILTEIPEPMGPGRESIFKWDAAGKGRHMPLQKATLIYGVVKYRDIFHESRETWFCYQLLGYTNHRSLIRIGRNPAYNKNT